MGQYSNHIFEICFLQNTAEMFNRHPFLSATDPDQEKRRKYLGEYSCISVIRDTNIFNPIFAKECYLIHERKASSYFAVCCLKLIGQFENFRIISMFLQVWWQH